MLSFKIIDENNKEEVLDRLLLSIPDADMDYVGEIADSLLEDCDCEYALSASHGCLLIRIFDEGYSFAYPVAVCEDSDSALAAYQIREYAVKEEIPLVFTDTPREELGNLLPLFRHANVDAEDEDGNSFTVKILSEVALMTEIPEICVDDVKLTQLTENNDAEYARLCKDQDTNKFWGYDYSADEPNPDDSYFREQAESEFSRGVALCLAVRVGDSFVGEATLYSFDLIGGCECAVRILPEFRGRSIATKALSGLFIIARRAGVTNLYATVDARNSASKKLCEKLYNESSESDGKIKFYSKL